MRFRGAFSTAHGMVDGVLNHSANASLASQPASLAGLAERDVLVFAVANHANGGGAFEQELAKLTARHAHERKLSFSSHQLSADAGRADQLRAAAGFEFDVVNQGAVRNVFELFSVAGADIASGPAMIVSPT